MRILVVSDSHGGISFMLRAAKILHPDGIIHLGDYYDDGELLRDECSYARAYLVAGNCDHWRAPAYAKEILCEEIGGVRCYLTHGHRHDVKNTLDYLIASATSAQAQVVLFGHTHRAYCAQTPQGMWVMNPGSCGTGAKSVGLLEICDQQAKQCRLIDEWELEELA